MQDDVSDNYSCSFLQHLDNTFILLIGSCFRKYSRKILYNGKNSHFANIIRQNYKKKMPYFGTELQSAKNIREIHSRTTLQLLYTKNG